MATPDTPPSAHANRQEFVSYYAEQSQTEATQRRFEAYHQVVMDVLGHPTSALDVADLGCGAGTQSLIWARAGHRVRGVDVSAQLIEIAGERARAAGYTDVEFRVASASKIPLPDAAVDVCMLVELLEHVEDWEACLEESVRILRPGGVLMVTTTNRLCPKQQEFDLPFYSWYPAALKRRYVRLARTTRPELAGHATFPAMHWFTFFGLRRFLAERGCRSRDRFDVMRTAGRGTARRLAVGAIRAVPPARWLAHTLVPSTWVVATKQ
jgi:2-polyprenyl-6-hydroxyphenyl methylase/3-demethylubiquinone-9 3-methyltransferase